MTNEGLRNPGLAEQYGLERERIETGEKEIAPEIEQTASNLIDMLCLAENEDFVVVTDTAVMEKFPEMLQAIELVGRRRLAETGGHFEMLVATAADRSAVPFEEHIGSKIQGKPVLIITQMSRSWSEETQNAMYPENRFQSILADPENSVTDSEAVKKYIASKASRLISITKGTERDVLTEGAALEKPEDLIPRIEYLRETMKGVERVHVTNPNGTDLWIEARSEFAEWESGKIDKPGQVMNFPIGEWACLIGQKGTFGTLVIKDAPMGGRIRREMVPDKVSIKIKDGQIVSVEDEGSGAGQLFRDYLDSGKATIEGDERADVYKIAEFGVGANSKAFREIDGRRVLASTSVEAEKMRGTIHIAFGANGTFGQDKSDPEFNAVSIHCDCVVESPTVECFKTDGTSFRLIKDGETNGY